MNSESLGMARIADFGFVDRNVSAQPYDPIFFRTV